MTSRRFESISGILNRVNSEPDTVDQPHEELPDPRAKTVPSPPANVTNLHPTASQDLLPALTSPLKASAESTGGVRRIAFRLDPSLHSALTAAAARNGSSHGQVVLDAIEVAHQSGTLTNLVASEARPLQSGGLFPRLKGRGAAQPTVPVEIRLHAQAVVVLDSLVAQTRADSRTQLIVAALRQRFGTES